MTYKKLYIVRHGETEYNRKRMVQGSGIDAPINEKGQQQALAFYNAYKGYPFKKAYVSTLVRTQQSIQSFLDKGLSYEALSGLDEINWGNKEGASFSAEAHGEYLRITNAWNSGDLDVCIDGGESPNEVMARQKLAMEKIMSDGFENILICMHGRAMRILICWLLGYPLDKMDMFEHTNLGLYKLTHTGSMFSVDWANETSHLIGIN